MKRSRTMKIAPVAGLAAIAMLAAACGSSGGSTSTSGGSSSKPGASAPGITATSITIGSTQPLTGVAAPGYDEISQASEAYFQYLNAHGGIFGRKINYIVKNDQYNPSITSTMTRQLVLNDNIFADFDALGTPTHLAVAPFLNSEKVPDIFVASGCECWNAPKTWPDTFGWQLDYVREGKILGNYVKQHFAGKKIGIFYQNDEFGLDGVKGLDYELPASSVVAKEPYDDTNTAVGPQVAKLKAAGAQVVISFSVPAFTALLKLNMLGLGFNPTLVVSSVGSDAITLGGLLQAFAAQSHKKVVGNQLTQGIITDGYLPALGAASTNTWLQLFQKIHTQYIPKLPFDGNVEYGMSVAYSFAQAMEKAGKNPTRQDLLTALEGGLSQGASVAPYAYSASDHNGGTGAYVGTIENGVLVQQGPVLITDTSPTGAITSYTTPQPAVPASGIPSP
ncbi:MAG: ABC transporter substrate-binding protein [Actinomycetota bacterium]|nr:ABC transporter substrate-binding protein [Actinomycetota bacterium]